MPEDVNLEVAKHLSEKEESEGDEKRSGGLEFLEVLEALVLALVTIATAWSGYEAARFDGRNALYYGQASKYRTTATQLSTAGGQQKLLDVMTFNTWIQADEAGNKRLAELYVKRFSKPFRIAFDAWKAAGGITNKNSPPGPSFMPEYHNPLLIAGAVENARASKVFEEGTNARERGDEYVRTTVFLASILFLVALSQRFNYRLVRRMLLGIAFVLLIVAVYTLLTYPVAFLGSPLRQ